MQNYYLAVDLGASGGRHILGYIKDGKIEIEEIYRFENSMKKQGKKLLWDVEYLFAEIINGMKKCRECGKIPISMSIDTWAVDYVLLDENDEILGDTYGYRDSRTAGMDEKVYEIIPEKELYAKTGIQKQIFNTIYQLMAVKQQTPKLLEKAKNLLMLPDYFQFLLTGIKASEYTNATSTQLVSPEDKQWDRELIARLGYPDKIFLPLKMPGTALGNLKEEIQNQAGFDCKVVMCASHDTASAVMAIPASKEDAIYISSGTWSLMGVESETAHCDEDSRLANFTSEGGYGYRFRYLKNIMGLWMIQSVRKEFAEKYTYEYICEQASRQDIPSTVDCNDDMFLAPASMIDAVKSYCEKSGQQVPQSEWEIAAVIYNSLGKCYGDTAGQIQRMTGKKYERIYVVGGGSNAEYLNQITAEYTGRTIYAGPGEATAIGNLLAQMIYDRKFENLEEARECVMRSFEIKKFDKEDSLC